MSWEAWVTIGTVLAILVALMRNLGPPDVMFLAGAVFLGLLGLFTKNLITPQEAIAGFSNTGVITVGMLFVIAAGLRETGGLDFVGQHVLGKADSQPSALRRLAWLVIPLSAFMNNTPIVAMMVPVVVEWCRRNRLAASKLLIPLSYLTILGGTCTLIGTSTNLVVDGKMIESGMKGLHLFELAWVGVPYALIGTAFLLVFSDRLLPERKEFLEQLGETRREYLVEMLVQPGCRLIGQTIETAGLRHLPGLYLIEIDRGGRTIGPVGPDEAMQAYDRLVFTGIVSSIVELETIPGLVPAADPSYEVNLKQQRGRQLCEAVISPTSPLIGQSIREADFRATYGAAVVAVHRNGSRLTNKVGDIELRPGDTLLLQTQTHFLRAYRNDPAFYLISDIRDWRPLRRDRAWIAVGLFAILVVVMSFDLAPIHLAVAAVALAMTSLGCISIADARNSVEWQVLVTIAAAFAIGSALENSGAAAVLARGMVAVAQSLGPELGPWAALVCIYLATMTVTELITNNAAALLMFPLCLETAKIFGVDARPYVIALTLAASASFITPIGYQTNMMVYGPGGYRFSDFFRVGTPISLLLWLTASIMIPFIWPFRP